MSNNYVNKYADFISQENLKESKKTMSKDYIATLEDPKDKVDEKDLEALGHVHEAELAAAEAELEEAFADIHEAISNSLLEDYDVSDITEEEFDDYVLDVIAEMVENSDELLESEDLQENAGLAVLKLLARLKNSKAYAWLRDDSLWPVDRSGFGLRPPAWLRPKPPRSTSKKITADKKSRKEVSDKDITEEEFDDYVLDVIAEMVENSDELLESEDLQENAGLAVLKLLAKAFKAPIEANEFRKEVSDKIGKMAADKLRMTPAAAGAGVAIGREIDKQEIDKKINKKSKGPHTEEYGDDAPKAKRGRPSKDEGDVEHPFQQVRTAHTKGRVQGDHIRITHPSTNANKMIHKDDVKAYYNKYVNSQKPAQKEQCTSDFLAKHFGAGMTRAQMLKHY